jgi:hypothetical protein
MRSLLLHRLCTDAAGLARYRENSAPAVQCESNSGPAIADGAALFGHGSVRWGWGPHGPPNGFVPLTFIQYAPAAIVYISNDVAVGSRLSYAPRFIACRARYQMLPTGNKQTNTKHGSQLLLTFPMLCRRGKVRARGVKLGGPRLPEINGTRAETEAAPPRGAADVRWNIRPWRLRRRRQRWRWLKPSIEVRLF